MISAQFAAADDKCGLPLTVAYSPATRGIDSATNLILASKARTIELLLEDVSGSRVAPGVIQDLILVCAELAAIFGKARASIIEIRHQRTFTGAPLQVAEVEVVLETRGKEHASEIFGELRAAGYTVRVGPVPDGRRGN